MVSLSDSVFGHVHVGFPHRIIIWYLLISLEVLMRVLSRTELFSNTSHVLILYIMQSAPENGTSLLHETTWVTR
jgi:hypothetical protein